MDYRRSAAVLKSWQQRGLLPDDGQQVVRTSLRWLGAPYGVTTATGGAFLDCSSLVSQSHWEAAGILVPFTVAGQRRSIWAEEVPSLASAAVGDVLIHHDAGRQHAGLLAGWDADRHLVLESVPGEGCRLAPIEAFGPVTVIRRFVRERNPGAVGLAWTALARAIPKMGRHGARLDRLGQHRHHGFDICVIDGATRVGRRTERGVAIRAPVDGRIIDIERHGDRSAVTVRTFDDELIVELRWLDLSASLTPGTAVADGQSLGTLAIDARACADPDKSWPACHVRAWVASDAPQAAQLAVHLSEPAGQRWSDANVVYAVRTGAMSSPVAPEDLDSRWTPDVVGGDHPSF